MDAPKRPARRRNSPGGRHIVYRVKVNEAENKALQDAANNAGVTVSRFLAESALGGPGERAHNQARVATSELLGMRRTLNSAIEKYSRGQPTTVDIVTLNRKIDDLLERM